MKKVIELTFSKQTKGTFVYSSDADGAIIKSVYLTRAEMPEVAPAAVTITVEVS